MGRIKSVPVKALGDQLLRQYPARFTADFAKNKAALAKLQPIRFKRVRNTLAGYLANEVRKRAVPRPLRRPTQELRRPERRPRA